MEHVNLTMFKMVKSNKSVRFHKLYSIIIQMGEILSFDNTDACDTHVACKIRDLSVHPQYYWFSTANILKQPS